jgi:hypothetical protein
VSESRIILGNTNSTGGTSFIGLAYSTVTAGSEAYTLRFPNAPPSVDGYVLSADTNGVASWVESVPSLP